MAKGSSGCYSGSCKGSNLGSGSYMGNSSNSGSYLGNSKGAAYLGNSTNYGSQQPMTYTQGAGKNYTPKNTYSTRANPQTHTGQATTYSNLEKSVGTHTNKQNQPQPLNKNYQPQIKTRKGQEYIKNCPNCKTPMLNTMATCPNCGR